MFPLTPNVLALLDLAIEEDLGRGDVTTMAVLGSDADRPSEAIIVAGQSLIVCGMSVVAYLIERFDRRISLAEVVFEGSRVDRNSVLGKLNGPASSILALERTLLNLLMRMCGVATKTYDYVKAIKGTKARVVDTRKTIPGWRLLDKYAVRMGGASNHRSDLGSGILIKDNHLAACGSLSESVMRARRTAPHGMRIEVEVDTFGQLDEALSVGVEIILLDNMSVEDVARAVKIISGRAQIEVSGGITLETIRGYAECGVDYISVGALTHSAIAADVRLDIVM